MDAHALRRRLRDGLARTDGARHRSYGPLLGTFVKLPGPTPIDLAVLAGLDLVVVDLEHSLLSEADALAQVHHATARDLPAVVRVAAVDAGQVNRLLEAGAAGIQLSTVRTAAAAEALRAATRHAPEGRRSVSLAHPTAAYGRRPLADHIAAEAAAPPLCIGQIETATTDDPLAEVVAPLDVAFLGTTDLTVDLGVPGQLAADVVRARVAEVAAAAATAGIALGAFAGTAEEVAAVTASGARYVVASSDLALLGGAMAGVVSASRSAVTATEEPS
ncbi:MAG TPA: aldolase/citrate lyase family protein [Iamia sp.]|nr:aldolase/citrate lyase family protein [Iamia sp.]